VARQSYKKGLDLLHQARVAHQECRAIIGLTAEGGTLLCSVCWLSSMFFFFSSRLGCLGSLLLSAVATIALLFLLGVFRF
jgi:hypothetical protein